MAKEFVNLAAMDGFWIHAVSLPTSVKCEGALDLAKACGNTNKCIVCRCIDDMTNHAEQYKNKWETLEELCNKIKEYKVMNNPLDDPTDIMGQETKTFTMGLMNMFSKEPTLRKGYPSSAR